MRPSPRHEGARAGRAGQLAGGVRGRREARGAGVLTERSEAERASTRRPEESLSAWDRERPRTRGATGAPAPQRPSRGHRAGEGPPAPATGMVRTGVQRPDPEAERSGARGRVGTGNGCGTGIGNGVAWVTYIHIYSNHTHERPSPPDFVRGEGRECVCACGRAGYQILRAAARAKR